MNAEQFWSSLTKEQKEIFVLTHCGSDTPMKRITASVDSISSYSCTSRATKKALENNLHDNSNNFLKAANIVTYKNKIATGHI